MATYLALDTIQPGDTILSSAPTARSRLIRAVTGSLRASHAAIALHPLIWFESIGTGVDYRFIQPELVWDGQRIRLAMPIPRGERFVVRRPAEPLFDPHSATARHAVARKLIRSSSDFAFLNYARPSAFLATARLGLSESAFARFVAAALDRDHEVFYPGPFCSWLVAECYWDLGRNIAGADSPSVTPAALARAKALATIDSGLVARPVDRTPRNLTAERLLNDAITGASMMIAKIRQAAMLAMRVTEINSQLRGFVRAGRHLSGRTLPRQDRDAFKGIELRQKDVFATWQAQVMEALDAGYMAVATRAEAMGGLDACQDRCSLPASAQRCEPGACSLWDKTLLDSQASVQTVFPKQPDE